MFKINNKNSRTRAMNSFLRITYFTPFSVVSIFNFEQVEGGSQETFV